MSDSAKFASVAVSAPVRGSFQYRVTSQTVQRGSRVRVPFGNRKVEGVVLSLEYDAIIDAARTKNIIDCHDIRDNVPESVLKLCEWAANYYLHPIGEVMSAALPKMIRQGWRADAPGEQLTVSAAGETLDLETLNRAPAQRRLLQSIRNEPRSRSTLKQLDISASTARTLVSKELAYWQETTPAEPASSFEISQIDYGQISPTPEQVAAIESIASAQTYLLDGITGSGKTEVYLRVMERHLRLGQQVLILVPEIGLTPQTIARFQQRFSLPIVVLNSSMTDRERALGWHQAKSGGAAIVLGTRSAIFTSFARLGCIIVDEEHDVSYKQQDGFRYSARDLAVLRGQFEKIPVILGSATPSLESLHNASAQKYQHILLRERPPGAVTESYDVLDTRHLQQREGFTNSLLLQIRDQLQAGNQVLVFLNRRGFAPVMLCNACNWIAQCRRCDAKLTYHLDLRTLICHHCGTFDHNVLSCQSCSENQISAVGQGTQRVEQTLTNQFPDFPVIRIDRDSTRRKNAMAELLDDVKTGAPAILVGTQLLAKGHHFPDVTLCALLDIDSGFYSSDFRSLERLGQLVLQVGGRSGRAEKPGKVLIQTQFANHPLLQALITEGYLEFAKQILAERNSSGLPPYAFCALIRAEAHDKTAAKTFLEEIADASQPLPLVNVLGPVPAIMERRRGRYRQQILLLSTDRNELHKELAARVHHAESSKSSRKVRWSVDVDPVDLF